MRLSSHSCSFGVPHSFLNRTNMSLVGNQKVLLYKPSNTQSVLITFFFTVSFLFSICSFSLFCAGF